MSRDYAKKEGSKKKSKKVSYAIWVMFLLIFVMFVGALAYIKNQRDNKNKIKQKITAVKKNISEAYTTAKFDFYNISSKNKLKNQEAVYKLEISTLNTFAAADHLKAKLTLLGFMVNIDKKLYKGKQRYYVSAGPYENKDKALADQKKLKRNKITSTLKNIK